MAELKALEELQRVHFHLKMLAELKELQMQTDQMMKLKHQTLGQPLHPKQSALGSCFLSVYMSRFYIFSYVF